ncbi:hypothetical protein [Spirosoma validum]|uniref:Uncharacterized protein n=1 Tax=Spirosoma validum TaxID=2771355 RepID=A0A927AY34_9BACT|nr:hypothetical protein [Spirosoma validum]MBD2751971.1 hypothetical protein [Spirosoma validum]
MKSIYWLLFSGLCLIGRLSFGQQTYFNVPSSDIVDKHEIAVQQQVNISESIRSSTTFNYGLGREWEIGFNLYNLDYLPSDRRIVANDSTTEKSFSPLLMLNAQKAFDITKNLELAIGAQGGMNVLTDRRPQLVGYVYGHVAAASNDEHYNFSAGGYMANARYLGDGPKVGFQTGFDAGIFYQKLHLLGDWISGPHDFGQLVLGVEVYLGKHLPLAIGWQRTNKTGSQAVVLQLTYNPE